jgi:hypothetical protein
MAALIAVDVETVPLAASLLAPYPREQRTPPANYAKPEAIEGWYAKDEAAWRDGRAKECALSPRLGRIVYLGYGFLEGGSIELDGDTAREEFGEKLLLQEFWSRLKEYRHLVGFNSHGFDFPFLLTRSLINGVVPGFDITPYQRRYTHTPHFDVRMALTGWDGHTSGTLSDWCTAFGIPCPTGKGSEVFEQYQAGDFDAIKLHCRSDIEATLQLAHRVGPTFWVSA